MNGQKSYVLEILDKWYFDRVNRGYTAEAVREVVKCCASSLGNVPHAGGLSNYLAALLSRENQLERAKYYFSEKYPLLEGILEGKELPSQMGSKGWAEEYMRPIHDKLMPAKKFVDEVRRRAEEIFPECLDNRTIEDSFRKIFPSLEDYMNMSIESFESLKPALDILIVRQKIDLPLFAQSRFIDTLKMSFQFIDEKVMGDLYALN